jgi:hypothetical protein
MALKKGKTKSFTFRITPDLADQVAEAKKVAREQGLKWNITEVLTAALEREVKAVQKHIQKEVKPGWAPGQKSLDM